MKLKNRIKEWKTAALYYCYRLKKIEKHKVVFCNYNGKGYGCNPKYIAEELIRRHPDWDYVWLASDVHTKLPKQVRAVTYDSKEAIKELATAGVWVDNQRKLWFHRKRKNQFFIATWHGAGIPMKRIGADNPNNFVNKPYEHTSKHMAKITDVMISNSEACTEIFHRCFLYEKEILNCGYPRNDIFFTDTTEIEKTVRAYFHIADDTKIVLYAPTYRNGRKLDPYTMDCEKVLDSLQKKYGGKWKMLLRLHPSMREKTKELIHDDSIIDAALYEDMQHLLVASDILISDYSSVITEFALQKKPVFLYAADVSSYTTEREFYCDYRELPFPLMENNQQVETEIMNFDQDAYEKALDQCFIQYGVKEFGTAANTLANLIEEHIEKLG